MDSSITSLWLPPSPLEGPPLPRFLDPYLPWKGYWPWYKAAPPPPPPPTKANLYGVIRDSTTGTSVGNATVTLLGITVTSDVNGNYSFQAIEPGTYSLTAVATGYLETTISVTILEGQNTLDIDLEPVGVGPCDLPAGWQWMVDSLMDTMGLTYEAALGEACKRYNEWLFYGGQVHFTALDIPSIISVGQMVTATCFISLPYEDNALWGLRLFLTRGELPPYGGERGGYVYDFSAEIFAKSCVSPRWAGVWEGIPLTPEGTYQMTDTKELRIIQLDTAPTPQGLWDVRAILTRTTIYPDGEAGWPQIDVWQLMKVREVTVV